MPPWFTKLVSHPGLRRQMLRRAVLCTLGVAVFLALGAHFSRREQRETALARARDSFKKDATARLWATQRGGAYVPLDDLTPANPYLKDHPDREITTRGGKVLTLVNHAYLIRMLHDLGRQEFGLQGHLTSLRPLRPENGPDPWERKALETLQSGPQEFWEELSEHGGARLRYMGALVTTEACLGCHATQGYRVGDVRGGISVTVPLAEGSSLFGGVHDRFAILGTLGLWLLGLGAIVLSARSQQGRAEERQRAQEALRESEEQLRVIVDASEAGIILVSPGGEIRFANPRMAELFGTTQQGLVGTAYIDHLHPSERADGAAKVAELVRGERESAAVERRYLRVDGTEFWGQASGRRLVHPDGSTRALVTVISDITDRRRMEAENLAIQQKFQQAQKMESLGILAGGVAHDMNNVLGAILGLASAHLEAHPDGSPAHRAFETISKAAVRGGKLVKGLLSFARQSPAEARDLDLNAILRDEARLLERTTLSKVRLEMDLAQGLRPIRGDASALTHAFMNLCVNAVDAMPDNGTLTLRTLNVDEDWIEVQVEDTGTGMSREVLEKAMDPFFTTKDQGKGTGLGLSMVYSTVKAHHGQIELQSQPGRGTRVLMRFPACQAEPPATEPAAALGEAPARSALLVLLVDDDDLIRGSMQTILEVLGHATVPVASGEAALEQIGAGLEPDLVLLDMNMPGLGGAGTLPRLRALRPSLPVLLATGRADQTALDLVDAHPGVTLLSKPFTMAELQRHLDGLRGA